MHEEKVMIFLISSVVFCLVSALLYMIWSGGPKPSEPGDTEELTGPALASEALTAIDDFKDKFGEILMDAAFASARMRGSKTKYGGDLLELEDAQRVGNQLITLIQEANSSQL